MSEYFDGREMDTKEPDALTVDEIESLPSEWIHIEQNELYPVNSVKRETKRRIWVGCAKHCYPRPPTENLARQMYLNDELTEREYEQMLETVFAIEGIEWGEP